MVNLLLAISDGAWIGLKRSGTAYKWEDGTPLSFTKWAPGEPDNRDCVYMVGPWDDPGRQGLWKDASCSSQFREIICKSKP